MTRLMAVQRCPAHCIAAPMMADATASMSSQSWTTAAFLPPSSSDNSASDSATATYTCRPVAMEPVNVTPCTRGDPTSERAVSAAPLTTCNTPAGSVCAAASAINATAPGVNSDGLMTMQFPQASAGAIFRIGVRIGKFHGVTAAITPRGRLITRSRKPGRAPIGAAPDGCRHCVKAKRASCKALPASARASAKGLPCSSVMACAMSGNAASMAAAKFVRAVYLSNTGTQRQVRNASLAACRVSSTSAGLDVV